MTEDIGSDKHKRPSQPEIDLAVFRERLKSYQMDQTRMEEKLDTVIKTLSQIETNLALGNQRFDKIEATHNEFREDTTTRLTAVEADKRGPVAIIMATLSAIAAGATAWLK